MPSPQQGGGGPGCPEPPLSFPLPALRVPSQACFGSKRSRFIALFRAATNSRTKLSFASVVRLDPGRGTQIADEDRHFGGAQGQALGPVGQYFRERSGQTLLWQLRKLLASGSSTANDATSVCAGEASVLAGAIGTLTACPGVGGFGSLLGRGNAQWLPA